MNVDPLKVVFDTNILVSGHFWKGPPYRCMLAVEAGLATLVLSDPIVTEFSEKLTGKFRVSKSETDSILERWTTSRGGRERSSEHERRRSGDSFLRSALGMAITGATARSVRFP